MDAKPRWRRAEPLTWGEHKAIQKADLFHDLHHKPHWQQCHVLMCRATSAVMDAMSFPKHHQFPRGVVNGNEFARHIGYFLEAHGAIGKLWPNDESTWPDVGFVKIGHVSGASIEMAVMGNLSVCWLSIVNSVSDLSVVDGTPCTAALAGNWCERIGHHLCEQCGSDFKPKRAGAKYCSPKCRSAAWRKKQTKCES